MNTTLHNHYPGDNEIYNSDRLSKRSRGLPQLCRGLSRGRRLRPAVNRQRKHTETRGIWVKIIFSSVTRYFDIPSLGHN